MFSDSCCWEVDAPDLEIAWKIEKAGWGAALSQELWPNQYTEKKMSEINLEWGAYPHCTNPDLDDESPQQKAEKHIMDTYPFVLYFFPTWP